MAFIGNTNTTQAFTPAVDFFSGNASTTAFTLSKPVASVAQVQVVVNNVAQNPSSAYTVSSNTITFTSAPSSGTNNIYVYYTSPITQVIAPGQNTVYPSSLSYTNALYWDTSGNVGIGTASPSKQLTVANDASISGLTVGKGGGAVSSNTAFGYTALNVNTSGSNLVAVGYAALAANSTGTNNTAVGTNSLLNTSTASGNTGIGYNAMNVNSTGASNTAVGSQALSLNSTASNNVAVGFQAGLNVSTASEITAVGHTAGSQVTTGVRNTFLGYLAGQNLSTGSYNVYIGQSTNNSTTSVSNSITIGAGNIVVTDKGTSTAFINANGGSSYNGANTTTWATTSDQRLKKNIVDNNIGLDKISAIQVRNFEYRLPQEVTELDENCAIQKDGIQLGVIAQELQQVLPDCVHTESTGVMSVQTDNLIWYMVNAIKEQQALITALTARITALENK